MERLAGMMAGSTSLIQLNAAPAGPKPTIWPWCDPVARAMALSASSHRCGSSAAPRKMSAHCASVPTADAIASPTYCPGPSSST